MPRGVIKKLALVQSLLSKSRLRSSTDDGFGVIDGDCQEVFFLASVVTGARFAELKVGQAVEYEIEPGPLGRAERVEPAQSAVLDAAAT